MRLVTKVVSLTMAWYLTSPAMAANPGNPAEELGTTGITVLEPLTITEITSLNFGRVIPGSSDTVFEVHANGVGTIIGVDSGDGIYVDGGESGEVTVSGTSSDPATGLPTITFATSNLVCPETTDVQLTSIEPNITSMEPLTFTAAISGRMKVRPMANGPYTCQYTITATYD